MSLKPPTPVEPSSVWTYCCNRTYQKPLENRLANLSWTGSNTGSIQVEKHYIFQQLPFYVHIHFQQWSNLALWWDGCHWNHAQLVSEPTAFSREVTHCQFKTRDSYLPLDGPLFIRIICLCLCCCVFVPMDLLLPPSLLFLTVRLKASSASTLDFHWVTSRKKAVDFSTDYDSWTMILDETSFRLPCFRWDFLREVTHCQMSCCALVLQPI